MKIAGVKLSGHQRCIDGPPPTYQPYTGPAFSAALGDFPVVKNRYGTYGFKGVLTVAGMPHQVVGAVDRVVKFTEAAFSIHPASRVSVGCRLGQLDPHRRGTKALRQAESPQVPVSDWRRAHPPLRHAIEDV